MQEEEDENVEENEEYQEGKLRFAGGRKEEATYDAGDEEDKQIAAEARREAERQGGEEEVGCTVEEALVTQTNVLNCGQNRL